MEKGIPQHKIIAEGGTPVSGNFGCDSLASKVRANPQSPVRPGKMSDAERHPPVHHSSGRLPAQANPNHGDH